MLERKEIRKRDEIPVETSGLLKSASGLWSTCLLVIKSDTWEISPPNPHLPSQTRREMSLFWKFTAWKQLRGFYIVISIWGGARFIQAGVRLERGLQRGHQAVGRITVTSLLVAGSSLWGTGVTMWLADLFQKPLDSKNKFKGDYSMSYHLHNLSVSNTSHIVKCVCVFIYIYISIYLYLPAERIGFKG